MVRMGVATHGLLYNMARYVALRGKNLEAYVKKEYLYIQKRFPVNKDKYRYILKN